MKTRRLFLRPLRSLRLDLTRARQPGDDHPFAGTGDFEVARRVEENRRARTLVNSALVRNLFDVNVEHHTVRQIDGLGVHRIAFEEHFDPVAVLSDGENDAGGILDRDALGPARCWLGVDGRLPDRRSADVREATA